MKNRFSKLLITKVVTPTSINERHLHPDCITNPRINDLNAKQAGLFSDLDVVELDKRIAREIASRSIPKKERPFVRVTVLNATKEQVQAALHNVHFKKR